MSYARLCKLAKNEPIYIEILLLENHFNFYTVYPWTAVPMGYL